MALKRFKNMTCDTIDIIPVLLNQEAVFQNILPTDIGGRGSSVTEEREEIR